MLPSHIVKMCAFLGLFQIANVGMAQRQDEINWEYVKTLRQKEVRGEVLSAKEKEELEAAKAVLAERNKRTGMEGDGNGPLNLLVPPVQISLSDSPILTIRARSSDGQEVNALWRKPKSVEKPPVIVFIHGGLTQYPKPQMERQLKSNPVITRFLSGGYAVVQATFRTYENDVQAQGPIEDVRAIVNELSHDTSIDSKRIALYGGSGGGSIALELASEKVVSAVVVGEPATVLYTGMLQTSDYAKRLEMMKNPEQYFTDELKKRTLEKLKAIQVPVMILHSDQHDLAKLNKPIFLPLMKEAGVDVVYREYPGFGHGFYFGAGDDRWGKGATKELVETIVGDASAFLSKHQPAP